jgi:type I restriction enzyme S subunit
MKHLRVPREITLADLKAKDTSWSAGMYQRVEIPNSNQRKVGELLAAVHNGNEVGSLAYVRNSPCSFIRTKALQPHSFLTQFKGGAVVPITPRAFTAAIERNPEREVTEGDVLYARGGSVGEVAFAYQCGKATLSGHMLRLRFAAHPLYCFAFLKHEVCKLQQRSNVAGSIAALDNFKLETLLDCRIPFPAQRDADDVIAYVAVLTEAIIEKEKAIRARNDEIHAQIEAELAANQTGKAFQYAHPTLDELRTTLRLDTGLYCRGFRAFQHRVQNYRRGATTLSAMGVRSRRGPNLAVSVIGKSLYAETYKPGWYELIRPVNIGEYGTLSSREWLGSPKKLPTVNRGDLILGCEGFGKGRSLVLVNAPERCTTNFHGTVLFWPGAEVWQTIFVRCFLAYLRHYGVVDWVGVGGSGGHMSPDYFDYLPFPRFPDDVRERIALLYHNPALPPTRKATLANFLSWHREWNEGLGIWELDREMKRLQQTLSDVQEKIIEGKTVSLPF